MAEIVNHTYICTYICMYVYMYTYVHVPLKAQSMSQKSCYTAPVEHVVTRVMRRVFSLCLPPLKVREANSGLIECIRKVDNVACEALDVRPDTGGGQPGCGHAAHNLSDAGLGCMN